MGWLSRTPPARPFRLFGPAHVAAVAAVASGCVALGRLADASPRTKKVVRRALVGALWAQELSFHAWRWRCGTWTVKEMVPLHACSLSVWLGGVGTLTGSRTINEFVYYLGFGGASQALLTPDLGPYGPPHYRFWQFFLSHGLLVALPAWQVRAEGLRPTWASAARSFGLLCAYAVPVYAVNRALGSNYCYVNRKPDTASILDAMPPWPRYLPILAGIAGAAFALLTLPFELGAAGERSGPDAAAS